MKGRAASSVGRSVAEGISLQNNSICLANTPSFSAECISQRARIARSLFQPLVGTWGCASFNNVLRFISVKLRISSRLTTLFPIVMEECGVVFTKCWLFDEAAFFFRKIGRAHI